EREGGVAAGEDEAQAVIGVLHLIHLQFFYYGELLELARLIGRAAQLVEGTVLGDGGQPRAGVVGNAVALPPLERPLEGVGGAVLSERPVTGDADEGGHHARPLPRIGTGGCLGCGARQRSSITLRRPSRRRGG